MIPCHLARLIQRTMAAPQTAPFPVWVPRGPGWHRTSWPACPLMDKMTRTQPGRLLPTRGGCLSLIKTHNYTAPFISRGQSHLYLTIAGNSHAPNLSSISDNIVSAITFSRSPAVDVCGNGPGNNVQDEREVSHRRTGWPREDRCSAIISSGSLSECCKTQASLYCIVARKQGVYAAF